MSKFYAWDNNVFTVFLINLFFLFSPEQNKTTSAVVSLLFKMNYDVYVKGKEENLKQ